MSLFQIVPSTTPSTFSPTLSICLSSRLSCPLRPPPSAPHFPYVSLPDCPVHYALHLQPHTFHRSLFQIVPSTTPSTFSPTLSMCLSSRLSCPLRPPPSAPHFPYVSLPDCPVHYALHLQPHTFHMSLFQIVLSTTPSTFSPTLSICLSLFQIVLSTTPSTFSPTLSICLYRLSCPLRPPPSAPHFPYVSLPDCPVHYVLHLQPHTFHMSLFQIVLSTTPSTFSPTLSICLSSRLSCPLRPPPSAPHFPYVSLPDCPVHYALHLQPHTFHMSLLHKSFHLVFCLPYSHTACQFEMLFSLGI